MPRALTTRRRFLALSALATMLPMSRAFALRSTLAPFAPSEHPTPRPGITADKLPTREQLADVPDAQPVFDLVREIPQIIDGIRCNCGCAESKQYYSLLTCYEGGDAMARHCVICQGQGKLAHRLFKAGKSLDEIRKGIDARFG